MKPEKKGEYNLEEEVILLLQSSKMTVCLEGIDDKKVFHSILLHKSLDSKIICRFFGEGGRNILLAVYDLYKQQTKKARNPILFFADQDTWVFTGIPEKYGEVNFTKGYSIENDLFEDGQISISQLLYPAEKVRLESLIDQISDWFAKEIQLILEGEAEKAKIDVSFLNPTILAPEASELHETYKVSPSTDEEIELSKQIKQNYRQFLRGKFLFELLQRISLDRGHKENLPLPAESHLFSTCIATGLGNDSSNSTRIAQTLQNTLNSTPPNNLA